jgi:Sec-independent protein translocase protein TatA
MDFLGVGPLELIFIIIIALVVIGPRDIGKTARSFGQFLNRLYKSENWQMLVKTSRTLRNLPQQLAREAALEELDLARQATMDELDSVQQALDEAGQKITSQVRSLEEEIQSSTALPHQDSSSLEKDLDEDQPKVLSDENDEETTEQ